MAWVRIHDGAMGNLKILRLSDSAFRLWVKGLCYCQTQLTDGLIPREALRAELGAKRSDVTELSTPQVEGKAPLWEPIESFGFKCHDYLIWNDTREKVLERQSDAKARKEAWKERKKAERKQNAFRTHSESDSGNGEPNLTKPNQTKDSEKEPQSRSKRPIFTGQRLTVFEWQMENHAQILGPYTESFDLHEWYFALDAAMNRTNQVIPKRDGGAWLESQLLAECHRRGLPVAQPEQFGKQTTRLAAALASIRAEGV